MDKFKLLDKLINFSIVIKNEIFSKLYFNLYLQYFYYKKV